MLLIVEERGKSSGERCRRDTRELHPLRPAALTGGDGHGASRQAKGFGEGSDQCLVRRTIDGSGGKLHDQLAVTHATDPRTTRAGRDTHQATGTCGGWDEGGHGECTMHYAQCRRHTQTD
jgi:hypothetical protein